MSGYLPQLVSILREGGVRRHIPENTEETGLCPGVGLKGGGAQSLAAKGWGSPGTRFRLLEGFGVGGYRCLAECLFSSRQKHLVCGPVKVAGAPGTLTAPEYYE